MERFDIYIVALQWRNSVDRRPVVLLSPQWYLGEKSRNDVLVALLSSNRSLFDERCHLPIREEDPEFAETGLKRESYVAVDYVTHVARTELKRRIGRLGADTSARLRRFVAGFLQLGADGDE